MKKLYLCERYPRYSIRSLYFQDGRYVTEDPAEQRLIEGCDLFGVDIRSIDLPDDATVDTIGTAAPLPEMAGARQGTRGTRQTL